MSNVIGLPGVTVPQEALDETNRTIVEYLEEMLEKAREGKIRTFSIVTLNMDDTATIRIIGSERGFELLGAVRMLEHNLITDIADANA